MASPPHSTLQSFAVRHRHPFWWRNFVFTACVTPPPASLWRRNLIFICHENRKETTIWFGYLTLSLSIRSFLFRIGFIVIARSPLSGLQRLWATKSSILSSYRLEAHLGTWFLDFCFIQSSGSSFLLVSWACLGLDERHRPSPSLLAAPHKEHRLFASVRREALWCPWQK